nr:SpoIIE family protein phosphatase [Streptomyces sp. WM6378]
MGLPARFSDEPRTVHETTLRPGDRVLLYTDGVTEARTAGGGEFGMDRFADSIIRATAAGRTRRRVAAPAHPLNPGRRGQQSARRRDTAAH